MPKKSQFVDFRAVRAAVHMEQVLQHYGLLEKFKRSGDNLTGCCPIHKGSNATQFRVSLEKNLWNCFSGGCHAGGNVLDFIAKLENVTVHAAALKAVEWFKLDENEVFSESGGTADNPPETRKTKPASRPIAKEPEKDKPNAPLKFKLEKLQHEHPYLIERGIALPTAIDFGVGYCAKGIMANHIAIPIHNAEGQVMAYCGRWPGTPAEDAPRYKLPKGFFKSQEVYNIDRASLEPAEKPLVIVEGFFDVMKLYQHGCKKVVALMGSTMSVAQEQLLRQHFPTTRHVIIALDEDEAGREGRKEIAPRLAQWSYVKAFVFEKEDMQPEHLSAEQVEVLCV
jgi:DNA primase